MGVHEQSHDEEYEIHSLQLFGKSQHYQCLSNQRKGNFSDSYQGIPAIFIFFSFTFGPIFNLNSTKKNPKTIISVVISVYFLITSSRCIAETKTQKSSFLKLSDDTSGLRYRIQVSHTKVSYLILFTLSPNCNINNIYHKIPEKSNRNKQTKNLTHHSLKLDFCQHNFSNKVNRSYIYIYGISEKQAATSLHMVITKVCD